MISRPAASMSLALAPGTIMGKQTSTYFCQNKRHDHTAKILLAPDPFRCEISKRLGSFVEPQTSKVFWIRRSASSSHAGASVSCRI